MPKKLTDSIVFKLDDEMRDSLGKLRKDGLKKGAYCGFTSLYEHYSLKEGSTTYIVAPPYSGKSVFINEIVMNLAEFEGWKWVIFSPETGSPKDLFAELLWVKLRKPFLINEKLNATEAEVDRAMQFIQEHFYILDPMHFELNEKMFYKSIKDIEIENGIKINGAVIDPITDFALDTSARQDLVLGDFLTRVRKFSSAYNIHTIIAFHTSAMGMIAGKNIHGENVRYLPAPTMFDVAGGQMASRKGMMILSLWRTPHDVIDPVTNEPFEEHELRVMIQKSKPKAMGKIGEVKLFYDSLSSRFYEKGNDNVKYFSQPREPEQLNI
jgi:twinkle protein